MTASVVVIPHAARGALADPRQRRRLSRGNITCSEPPSEALGRTLAAIGAALPATGLAALRYLADAGRAPAGWIAAADPVHFETRLRHLVVHRAAASDDEVAAVFRTLAAELDGDCTFECFAARGYVQAVRPFATMPVSVDAAVGESPDATALGGGDQAVFHRLLGEIQMLLHDHPVNRRRAAAGVPSLNSLWLWGGGELPGAHRTGLPPLNGHDPLFAGYWQHNGGELAAASPAGPGAPFVCIVDDAPAGVELALRAARRRPVTLVSRDGLTAVLGPLDRFRFWRGTARALVETDGHD